MAEYMAEAETCVLKDSLAITLADFSKQQEQLLKWVETIQITPSGPSF
ncbi:MAG: hypothetical protein WDM78_21735 [Puia sp.]